MNTLRFQLCLSLAYCLGAILTFRWLHRITEEQESIELQVLNHQGRLYVVWAVFAFLWPAAWVCIFAIYYRVHSQVHLKCLRSRGPKCQTTGVFREDEAARCAQPSSSSSL